MVSLRVAKDLGGTYSVRGLAGAYTSSGSFTRTDRRLRPEDRLLPGLECSEDASSASAAGAGSFTRRPLITFTLSTERTSSASSGAAGSPLLLPLLFLDDLCDDCGRGDDRRDCEFRWMTFGEDPALRPLTGVWPRVGVAGTMSRLSMSERGLLLSTPVTSAAEVVGLCSMLGSE